MERELETVDDARRTPVASLGRGLAVLEALALSAKGSLPELMAHTGFDRATVNRFLRSFIDAGYVERGGRGEYVLSSRSYLLGARLTSSYALARVAEPQLHRLHDEVNETVSLAVLSGTDVVYIARYAANRILSLNIDIGSRLPAYASSMGRAILAFMPEAEAVNVLNRSARQVMTPYTKVLVKDLLATFESTRKNRFVVTNQEFDIDLCSIASPIFNIQGAPVAAINIAMSTARMSAGELAKRHHARLRDTADEISHLLGWAGAPIPKAAEKHTPPAKQTRSKRAP